MARKYRIGIVVCLLGAALLGGSCEGPPGRVVTDLALERTSWDTVLVQVDVVRHRWLGRPVAVAPDSSTRYILFGADYDTLFAGHDALMPVPDRRLADREPLMVEVCSTIRGRAVCEQSGFHASPKRIRTTGDISYPDDEAYEEGRYSVRFTVEREQFDGTGWEAIDSPATPEGYVLAYVVDQTEPPVKVPIQRTRGRFNLAGLDGYDDFKYHLRSRLYEAQEARVRFDVYAGFSEQTARRVATVEKRINPKTPEERRAEVEHFARQATERLFEALDVSGRDARVYIDDWRFDPRADAYRIDLDLEWGRGLFSRSYVLRGTIAVHEDGKEAAFRIVEGNRRARALWHRYVDARDVELGTLDVPAPTPETAAGEALSTEERETMAWSW
jgi:hypothetical protein